MSSFHNNLLISGGSNKGDVGTDQGQSLRFDGSSCLYRADTFADDVTTPHATYSDMSFSFWIKLGHRNLANSNKKQTIFYIKNDSSSDDFGIYINADNEITIKTMGSVEHTFNKNSNGTIADKFQPLNEESWHHIAMTLHVGNNELFTWVDFDGEYIAGVYWWGHSPSLNPSCTKLISQGASTIIIGAEDTSATVNTLEATLHDFHWTCMDDTMGTVSNPGWRTERDVNLSSYSGWEKYGGRLNAANKWIPRKLDATFLKSDNTPTNAGWNDLVFTYGYGAALSFDSTQANGIGHDDSGMNNHYTATGFSSDDTDYSDRPTLNYAILDQGYQTAQGEPGISGNCLTIDGTQPSNNIMSLIPATFTLGRKSYWEVTRVNAAANHSISLGLASIDDWGEIGTSWYTSANTALNDNNGNTYNNGTTTGTGLTYNNAGNVVGISYDPDTGNLDFRQGGNAFTLNTSGIDNAVPVFGSTNGCELRVNFGQEPFSYTPPTGYEPVTHESPSAPSVRYPENQLYIGYGTTNTYNYTGTAFSDAAAKWGDKGGLWLLYHPQGDLQQKNAQPQFVYDWTNYSASNSPVPVINTCEGSQDYNMGMSLPKTTSLNSTGYVVSHIGWKTPSTWVTNLEGSRTSVVRYNSKNGLSIVEYIGNNSNNASVGHGLGAMPEFMICCNISAGGGYSSSTRSHRVVWHKDLTNDHALRLDSMTAEYTNNNLWGTVPFSTTRFGIGQNDHLNDSGEEHVAFVWHSIPGFSKFGSYIGTGSTGNNGQMIHLGFKPAVVLIKNVDANSHWRLYNFSPEAYSHTKPWNQNPYSHYYGIDQDQDIDFEDYVIEHSNGFRIGYQQNGTSPGRDHNIDGNKYIYAAWALQSVGGADFAAPI